MTRLEVVGEIQDGDRLVRRKTTILRSNFVFKINQKAVLLVFRIFSSLFQVIFLFPQEKFIKLLVTNAIDHR